MTADQIKAAYARNLLETVTVRRFTGTGTSRPKFDADVRGKAWGYASNELIGTIQQGDQRVLVLVDDLRAAQFALPVTTNDFVIVKGRQKAIVSPGERKAPDGTLVAYELQARG